MHRDEDSRRRQNALNILLITSLVLLGGIGFISQVGLVLANQDHYEMPWMLLIGLGLIGFLYGLARLGHHRLCTYALIGTGITSGTMALFFWSVDLPNGLLILVLVMLVSGLLMGAAQAAMVAAVIIVIMAAIGLLQATGVVDPDLTWLSDGVAAEDTLAFTGIFTVVAVGSWLSSREVERLLRRARDSEARLKAERDSLEQTVRRRTSQVQRLQLERILELQRLATIGKLTAGMLHDLANPITAASITLEQLGGGREAQLVEQAAANIHYLERYVTAARRQFQQMGTKRQFEILEEARQVVGILEHKAAAAKVPIRIRGTPVRLYADPVRFSQLLLNLIANAIEAYENVSATQREVVVAIAQKDNEITVTVQDGGNGIAAADLPHIFEAFFTTKQAGGQCAGIGLAMVHEIATRDLAGRISVTSRPGQGTTFTLTLSV